MKSIVRLRCAICSTRNTVYSPCFLHNYTAHSHCLCEEKLKTRVDNTLFNSCRVNLNYCDRLFVPFYTDRLFSPDLKIRCERIFFKRRPKAREETRYVTTKFHLNNNSESFMTFDLGCPLYLSIYVRTDWVKLHKMAAKSKESSEVLC